MTINGIPNSYRAVTTITAPKVKASEEGLFKPITAKVSGALSDEYIEQIKACARKAATEGTNMVSSGYAAARDAQMEKFISPDRGKAISQVSAALNDRNRVLEIRRKPSGFVRYPLYRQCPQGCPLYYIRNFQRERRNDCGLPQ